HSVPPRGTAVVERADHVARHRLDRTISDRPIHDRRRRRHPTPRALPNSTPPRRRTPRIGQLGLCATGPARRTPLRRLDPHSPHNGHPPAPPILALRLARHPRDHRRHRHRVRIPHGGPRPAAPVEFRHGHTPRRRRPPHVSRRIQRRHSSHYRRTNPRPPPR